MKMIKQIKRMASADNLRVRFYLALGYLVWALLPHFNLIYHTHAGGSHFHATLSPTQVKQANAMLEALGPAALAEAATPEVGGLDLAASVASTFTGAALRAADAASGLHGHYWEDANLAGLASFPGFSLITAALLLLAMIRYQGPLFRFAGKLTARGPPSLLPA
jgi:hypothetical protein